MRTLDFPLIIKSNIFKVKKIKIVWWWKKELKMALGLATNHLSLYQLTIEPGTPFFRNSVPTLNQDLGADLFETTLEMTNAAGFRAYEISRIYECYKRIFG